MIANYIQSRFGGENLRMSDSCDRIDSTQSWIELRLRLSGMGSSDEGCLISLYVMNTDSYEPRTVLPSYSSFDVVSVTKRYHWVLLAS